MTLPVNRAKEPRSWQIEFEFSVLLDEPFVCGSSAIGVTARVGWCSGAETKALNARSGGRTRRLLRKVQWPKSHWAGLSLSHHLATDLERPPSDRGGDQRRLPEPPAGAPGLGSPIRSITMSMNLVTSKGFCRI